MRWTRVALLTRALTPRAAKPCGPDASMVGVKFLRSKLLGDNGDNKARSPGRARSKPLKPSRAGMPGDPGATVVTTLVCYQHFAHEAAGATGTRHSPRPLLGEGFQHNSGVIRCGNMDPYLNYPRHCERSEAIHSCSLCCRMDCFASLAMTRRVRRLLHHHAQPLRRPRNAGVEPTGPAVLKRKTLVE
jgi:hypothetical protein